MLLDTMQRVFDQCIRECGVFNRDETGGSLVEFETIRKEKKNWLVVGAGLTIEKSQRWFPNHPKRAERSRTPLMVFKSAEAELLFVCRPIDASIQGVDFTTVTTFSPADRVPLIQLLDGYFQINNIDDDETRLDSIRWEFDLVQGKQQPSEAWLSDWKQRIGDNPAHAPSHLHINPQEQQLDERAGHSPAELRLAIGLPNPLTLLLSLATWIRASGIGL